MELKELRKPETSIDWSEHKLHITKNENVLIHDLKKPGSSIDRVTFINSMGVCAVTGDYGNWIFCREFHPSEDGWVSRAYWSEKLKIASTQHSGEFDGQFAIERIDDYLICYGKDISEEQKEWWNELKENAEYGEHEYNAHAYDYPDHVDPEDIPRGLKRMYWLSAVYDAFNEICNRIQIEKGVSCDAIDWDHLICDHKNANQNI